MMAAHWVPWLHRLPDLLSLLTYLMPAFPSTGAPSVRTLPGYHGGQAPALTVLHWLPG